MKKYPNLIKDIVPFGPNHIWVSGVTYCKTKAGTTILALSRMLIQEK